MRYRLIGFAAGFALVVAIAWLLGVGRPIAPQKVLSEQSGALKTVEIQYTRASAGEAWPVLSSFFDQIDPSVEVIAACGDGGDANALRRAWRWKNRLSVVVVNAAITGWSKDRFLVGDGTPANLIRPSADPNSPEERSNDSLVCEAIARQFPGRFAVRNAGLLYDAGDIVTTPRWSIFSQVLEGKNPSVKDLADKVRRLTGRAPLKLQDVPAHHIGMFAAPLDDRVVVVGDPDIGRRLWDRKAIRRLGRPDFSHETTQPFRNAAKQFQNAGFRVVRVPECVLAPQVYTTYTNGIFETRGDRRIVYLPVYGIESMDDAAEAAYRNEGWEVRPIPVARIFRQRGTIGCLVNVLERAR